ncbi:ABC transporter substrate-binding protein, partial [Vibrio natriegens]
VYTFHLRDNITWSNGEPITAGDFVYSFRRVINPKTAAPYAWYYGTAHIKNATAISEGKVPVEELGVSAPDDKTFQITLDKPVPYLLKMLVHESTYPVYQPAIEAHGDTWT